MYDVREADISTGMAGIPATLMGADVVRPDRFTELWVNNRVPGGPLCSKWDAIRLVRRGVLPLKPVPRPVWVAEAVRYIIGGLVVAGHRCRGRPGEVVMQHLPQSTVIG